MSKLVAVCDGSKVYHRVPNDDYVMLGGWVLTCSGGIGWVCPLSQVVATHQPCKRCYKNIDIRSEENA